MDSLLSFVNDRYVRWSIDDRASDKDFSSLSRAQVVLMGEFHNTLVMEKTHAQFVQLFLAAKDKNQPSTVMVEGLPPETQVNMCDMPVWKDFLADFSVVFHGADIRAKTAKELWIKMRLLAMEIKKLQFDIRKECKQITNEITQILNKSLRESTTTFENKNLIIAKSIYDEILKKMDQLIHVTSSKAQNITALQDRIKNLKEQVQTQKYAPLAVSHSNTRLANEIIKVCKKYKYIFVPWGLDHFVYGHHLTKLLENHKINYIILAPNGNLCKEMDEELAWQAGHQLKTQLSIVAREALSQESDLVRIHTTTLSLLDEVKPLLSPKIHALCRNIKSVIPAPIPFVFDRDNISDLFEESETLEFPPYTLVKFVGINDIDFESIQELSAQELSESEKRITKMKLFYSMLHNIFVLSEYCLSSVASDSDFSLKQNPDKLEHSSLLFSSSVTFRLTAVKGNIKEIYAQHLFTEMLRKKKQEYILSKNHILYFTDISEETIKSIAKGTVKIATWLSEQTPKASQEVRLLGGAMQLILNENNVLGIKAIETLKIVLCEKEKSEEKSDEKEDEVEKVPSDAATANLDESTMALFRKTFK